ncbi:MAG: hypothetical protein B7Z44_20540 [Caulobacter sp. 12-67-6]|nr:MAG: hypothetical protein B7Z44_20540 [Caulobacter sp. 12-67-6]
MPPAALPANEAERLAALHATGILDTAPDSRFDAFARLAAHLAGVPMAFVSLVDADRQWCKAAVGAAMQDMPRDVSFCAHAILEPGSVLVVEDAARDPRFVDNPLVIGPPHLRFYAGAPITDRAGLTLGTLCVADTVPRTLAADACRALALLAGDGAVRGAARPADRPWQPAAVRAAAGGGDHPGARAGGTGLRRVLPGPGPVQGGERPAGPCRRRRPAARSGAAADRLGTRCRYRGQARRRRIRGHPLRPRQPGGGRGPGDPPDRGAERALRL